MTWTVEIDGTDYSGSTINDCTIYWGREDLYRQPNPATCTISLVRSTAALTLDPLDFEVDQTVAAYVTVNGIDHYRFYGAITDISVNFYTIDIVAVSFASRWASYAPYVDLGPAIDPGPVFDISPVATGQKINALLSNFPGNPDVDYEWGELEVGWWYDQPAVIDYWAGVQAIVAGEPFGVLCEDMTVGPPTYWQARFTDATWRRNTSADITLTGDEIIRDWTITKQVGDKVNYLTVSVPAHPDGWWPDTTTNYDQPADTSTVRYTGNLNPTYSSPDSVDLLATSMIGLWRTPTYRLRKASIPMSALTEVRQSTILGLVRMSNLVQIPAILPGLPTDYFIEGCQDQVIDGKYVLTLFLSDTALSHPPDRWQDADPTLEWGQVSASLTWGDAYKERFD